MTRTLLGVRGLSEDSQIEKVSSALLALEGVSSVTPADKGQLLLEYDSSQCTIMDLIRVVREQGFLAGML